MQKKQTKISPLLIITVVLTLLLILGIFLFYGKRIIWWETFRPKEKQPYDIEVIYQLMQKVRGNQEFILINDSTAKNLTISKDSVIDNYIFIGKDHYADSSDVQAILNFVESGNRAFILCPYPEAILNELFYTSTIPIQPADINPYETDTITLESNDSVNSIEEDTLQENPSLGTEDDEYYYNENNYTYDEDEVNVAEPYIEFNPIYHLQDSIIHLHTDGMQQKVALEKIINFKHVPYYWAYFNDSLKTKNKVPIEILGTFNEEYTNYIRIKMGDGELYLHTTPLAFTNLNMLNDTVMNYCRNALQYMGNGKVYWDEENRTYSYSPTANQSEKDPNKPQQGPLEFILSERSLRNAWYLLLAATALYLFFGAKRKQRALEPLENMENTSIEYAEVISQMFMNQKDHKKLVMMKMDLFKHFIRDRYALKLPLKMIDEDDTLYAQIALKSNTPVALVKDIFEDYKVLGSIAEVETQEMLQFHKKIERFHLECK